MKLIELTTYLASKLSVPAYPLEFPVNNKNESVIAVDMINGSQLGGVTDFTFQIMTRSSHPSTAEEQLEQIIDTLHNVTNDISGTEQIILIQAQNPNPFYSGQDKNGNYIYTANFRMLIS